MRDIAALLEDGTPFALYREPEGEPRIVTDNFAIHPWLSNAGLTLDATPAPIAPLRPAPELTREQYIQRVGEIIHKFGAGASEMHKTVYSRIINGHGALTAADIAQRLMSLEQPTLRAMWYHPQCGLWVASTPEVLLDVELRTGRFRTMALAGTRPTGTAEPWDAKNIAEQQIVAETIAADLRGLGLSPEIGTTHTLRSGGVEHRCTIIEGDTQGLHPGLIANALSPTPALGGYPRTEALADIERLEIAPRECYGGYVAIIDANRWRAYVVIRCARIDLDGNYRIYAGGGITADSDPQKEWCETVAKSCTIADILGVGKQL